MIPNPAAGITREFLISCDNRTVEVEGVYVPIKVGISGPDCEVVQIGCEREVRAVLPGKITLVD